VKQSIGSSVAQRFRDWKWHPPLRNRNLWIQVEISIRSILSLDECWVQFMKHKLRFFRYQSSSKNKRGLGKVTWMQSPRIVRPFLQKRNVLQTSHIISSAFHPFSRSTKNQVTLEGLLLTEFHSQIRPTLKSGRFTYKFPIFNF